MPRKRMIVTTEKDAARLIDLDGLSEDAKDNIYALPIEIEFMLEQQEQFDEFILSYIYKNSKNSILSKMKNKEEEKKQHQKTNKDKSK